MLRLISLLLFLGGIAAAALGAMVLMEQSGMPRIGGDTTDASIQAESWPADAADDTMESYSAFETEPAPQAALDESMEMAEMPDAPVAERVMEAAPPPPMAGMPSTADTPPTRTRRSATRSLGTSEEGSMGGIESVTTTIGAPGFDASMEAAAPEMTAGERFLETLKTVPIAHETPQSAGYKQSFDVVLAIDATGDDDATDALPGRGNIVAGEAQVSDRVEARLSGAAFEIESSSPGIQTLSPVTENTWRWSVSALSPGEHDLVFEIFAIDQDAATPLRTYRDTVTVEVTGISRAIAFADQANPVFVLLGGLGSAVAGLFGVIQFFRRRP